MGWLLDGNPLGRMLVYRAARKQLEAKTGGNYPAPFAALEAVEHGLRHGIAEGLKREAQLFGQLAVTDVSRKLVQIFFATNQLKKDSGVAGAPVTRLGIVGSGFMGSGIAGTAVAQALVDVRMKDADLARVANGLRASRDILDDRLKRRRITRFEHARLVALLSGGDSYAGFWRAELVIEAVFEDIAVKEAVFRRLDEVMKPGAVLASNTSTLDLNRIAEFTRRPMDVVGTHFFSPANVMKLLEIVRGRATSHETIATSVKLSRRLAKIGVVVGNCFGFVANRMLAYYMREAYLLLEEGASVPQIDRVLTDFGLPVGPFGMQDIAGIDVGARIRQYLKSIGKSRAEGPQSAVPDRLFAMGRYGQKTGAGWYKYDAPGSRNRTPDPLIDQLAAEEAARRGVTRRAVSDDEIIARITTALANEGARVLEDGFATRAGDIDIIYAYGFGFPRQSGGPMFYAETVGLDKVLARVKEYRARFGDYWEPAPLLERMVAEGRGFYSEPALA